MIYQSYSGFVRFNKKFAQLELEQKLENPTMTIVLNPILHGSIAPAIKPVLQYPDRPELPMTRTTRSS